MRREPPGSDSRDAILALQEFGGWIKNADTKATILVAATSVVVVALLSRTDLVIRTVRADVSSRWIVGLLLVATIICLTVLAVCVYQSVRPRKMNFGFSRFAWPSVAELDSAPVSFSSSTFEAEAWAQSYALALIARQKFKWFNRALITFWLSLLFFAVLVVVLQLPH